MAPPPQASLISLQNISVTTPSLIQQPAMNQINQQQQPTSPELYASHSAGQYVTFGSTTPIQQQPMNVKWNF